ncbi:uncharacterized protein BJ171DRAFT_519578 [Polychytrium aggregatum]|uniref:uncharacterized protein n=1 Tax=Polychytrium aggregatum TaxID=110093 RepID=UPI0022FE3AC7|nr:uncharacterized protein BJ171DRAFT_519578 [Polychytrium aggregatum]KAI9197455.1 hypothetical protein BJ171DRAFT_519578 [Polychytrium aggregatum]
MTSMWLPLESNPDVMNEYVSKLGISSSWIYTDVYGFDPELLGFIPRPCRAVLLLFPITEKYEQFRKDEQSRIEQSGQTVSDQVYFVRQTIGNACGTIGLIHSLLNNRDAIDLGNGAIKSIWDQTQGISPEQRAKTLESSKELARIHDESSHQGQTHAPSADEEVDLHFICFVEKERHIYELDGRKPFPINHGVATGDLLNDSVEVIKKFMEREPDQLNFTAIALVRNPDEA